MHDVRFSTLRPSDLFAIQLQPSQRMVLGMVGAVSEDEAEVLCASPVAWSAWVNDRAGRGADRLFACFGIAERFAGVDGVGWALLSEHIGEAHTALTRFARSQVEGCGLPRVEVLTRAPDLEPILARRLDLDSGQIVALARSRPTPEMRWAQLLGFTPVHLLRCFGADCESVMLCERITPPSRLHLPESEAA